MNLFLKYISLIINALAVCAKCIDGTFFLYGTKIISKGVDDFASTGTFSFNEN